MAETPRPGPDSGRVVVVQPPAPGSDDAREWAAVLRNAGDAPPRRPAPGLEGTRRLLLWIALGLQVLATTPPHLLGGLAALLRVPLGPLGLLAGPAAAAGPLRVCLLVLGALVAGLAFARHQRAEAELPAGQHVHAAPRIAALVIALALCFPVLGICTALWVAVTSNRRALHEHELLSEYRELVDARRMDEELPADARPHLAEATWRALELTSFGNVIEKTTDSAIIASAFESAQKLDRATACALFRGCLGSRVAVTRYYASTALAREEERCDRGLAAADAKLADVPGDPEALIAVGDARMGYAEIGDPADPVTRFHTQEATRAYQSALERLPESHALHGGCRARLARAQLGAGDAAGAWRHFAWLLESGTREVSTILGAAEACHQLRDYHGLARALKIGRERCPDSPLMERAAEAWGQPA